MRSALLSSAIWQKPTLGNVAMVYIYTLPHCQMGYGFENFHFNYLIINIFHFSIFSKSPLPKGAVLAMICKPLQMPPHGAKFSSCLCNQHSDLQQEMKHSSPSNRGSKSGLMEMPQ
jgi:hypothetical protein